MKMCDSIRIPKNFNLNHERLKVKSKMIADVISIASLDGMCGMIYGGAVRDLISSVLPEDIDIKVMSTGGIKMCFSHLNTHLKKKGYTVRYETLVPYTDHYEREHELRIMILKKLVALPVFEAFAERIERFIDGEKDPMLIDEINHIGIDGRLNMDDVLHIQSCTRMIVCEPQSSTVLNIDITRIIQSFLLHRWF